ncbi:ubiquitin fusion degradation protein UFD1, partial [Cooperia oncophora]
MMNILSGMMGMGGGYSGRYSCQMRAYSAAFIDADSAKVVELNYGGKVSTTETQTPLWFFETNWFSIDFVAKFRVGLSDTIQCAIKVSSVCENSRSTNCGVLEFSAPEGKCYLPQWMMKQLRIDEGAEVRVDSVTLQSATYAKLKPQSLEFLNISNPRAVLEVELRKFACLTKNDIIAVL